MDSPAADIARRLAASAEAVCRRYLSNGRREGRYWLVGDVHNSPGRSLYVRLSATAESRGGAGKWTDAQSGDHGDLLDIIAASCAHRTMRETLDEARMFLSLPPTTETAPRNPPLRKAPSGTPEAARRLWAASKPIRNSIAARYLERRSITDLSGIDQLRFHPRCYYRATEDDAPGMREAWPAMIASVTDNDGVITGVHRTWLDPQSCDKAAIACPRRAMGHLLGSGVRFGQADRVMVAGEGLETLLSLRQVMPSMPMIAGLSAAHLAAINFPADLRCLYVARDDDLAGTAALSTLIERCEPLCIEIMPLEPRHDDFNSDLTAYGLECLAAAIRVQLSAADAVQFLRR